MADTENRVLGVATSSSRAREGAAIAAKGRVGVENVSSHSMAAQLKAPPGLSLSDMPDNSDGWQASAKHL